ncbi:probable ATP-dependent RNA helicase vasa-like isoform X2 [Varroa destructor]|uniref:RNA helicase n=2 Tax=Varroa destructor TaxID=109461 RepID=A0A7M7MBI9_VARDE|nr:probable ATP-dependent RNA helicase vasa-like isoform X2 [Varroa destructor]
MSCRQIDRELSIGVGHIIRRNNFKAWTAGKATMLPTWKMRLSLSARSSMLPVIRTLEFPTACRKCNEVGHMARECYNASSGRNRGRFNCGQSDHLKGVYLESSRDRACRKCNEERYIARDCLSAPQRGSRVCFNCRQLGHKKSESPRQSGPLDCWNCHWEGHKSADCVNKPGQRISKHGQPVPKPATYVPGLGSVTEMMSELCYGNGNIQRFDQDKVTVSDAAFAVPLQSFDEIGFCPVLLEKVNRLGYATLTPIQRFSIPVIMAGKDLIACSQTGSGKSAAFILPILQKIMNDKTLPDRASIAGKKTQKPLVVVISPTRELCRQLNDHFRVISDETPRRIGVAYAYGRTHVQSNRGDIRRGTHVLCAVPGRLKQFLEDGTISFSEVRYIILDEADRMLDHGFEEDIRFFNAHKSMPPKENRQMLMFSATFPPEVEQLARQIMRSKNTVKVVVGTLGGVNADVTQSFIETQNFSEKREQLIKILDDYPTVKRNTQVDKSERDRIIVFVEQKKRADTIGLFLNLQGYATTTMHGDREQEQREEALRTLKQGEYPILVATAVAARGLDIKAVSLVINFDLPKDIDDYVHRVGRTGRVGRPGKAISFYNGESDSSLAPALIQALNECGQPVPDFLSNSASGNYFNETSKEDDGNTDE